MENSPFNTNNPYKKTPKSQSTLPLEPRVPREAKDADEPYKPQPERPKDFQEQPQRRATVNFTAQPAPRKYEAPESYSRPEQPSQSRPEAPQERPTQPPAAGMRPRPTVTYQPGQEPEIPRQPRAPRPYPTPSRPGQAVHPSGQPNYRPTVPADGPRGNGGAPRNPGYRPTVLDSENNRGKSSLGLIIGIVAVALIIVGAGCWWYFGYRNSHPIVTDDVNIEEVSEITYTDNTSGNTSGGEATGVFANGSGQTASPDASQSAASTAQTPGVSAGTESTSLFNRPLTYTGTVTPGGVASLNIILFQNGRLEGTIDYSDGKSMPLFGSYTWTDNGHMMNVNFTVSSKKDKTYSESWMGHSSYIKDDLAHTLTFKRINTSNGQSMTASFALRP